MAHRFDIIGHMRPWMEVFDFSAIQFPHSFNDAKYRFQTNQTYFRINYGIIVFAIALFPVIAHWKAVLVLLFLGGLWYYVFNVRTADMVVLGRALTDRDKIIGLSILSLGMILAFTKVGGHILLFFFLGLLFVSLVATMRLPENLFVDDADGYSAALMNMRTTDASSTRQGDYGPVSAGRSLGV